MLTLHTTFKSGRHNAAHILHNLSRTTLVFALMFFAAQAPLSAKSKSSKAKYVFYFIGDGMGVNQVNATESYLGAVSGTFGIQPLCFPSFPYSAFINTCSASSGVTDSAASGTALATGHKTKNGALGVKDDLETPVQSIASIAKEKGYAVGVTTTVGTDHATPAAFYAHVKDRGMSKEIRKQREASGFDFILGGPDGGSLVKRLDRRPGQLSLQEITRQAIDSLSNVSKRNKDKGFFLMEEGGMIDWACHSNDPGTMIGEMLDFDESIQIAYEFYKQHPDETLIVITADHETGGLVVGHGKYEHHLDLLQYQKMTIGRLGSELNRLRKEKGADYGWPIVRQCLTENFGFWDKIKLTDKQTKRLETAFEHIESGIGKGEKTLYQEDDELCVSVRQIMCEQAHITFAYTSHSAGYVPCFAVGAGAELFTGRFDNTQIPVKIQQAMGW